MIGYVFTKVAISRASALAALIARDRALRFRSGTAGEARAGPHIQSGVCCTRPASSRGAFSHSCGCEPGAAVLGRDA
ncbi:hypothetical protein Rhow_002640 [Rhodococcus wratislaviensis]|uniref:Uncharacterized protein n=1 Tax=Rhodococcus wratislaviensis TaxID=44752 RepID=A0A402C673_RHOWR|nr:hypothetical protein Rhow_002640 [Rhodococcus wratislaviensis]